MTRRSLRNICKSLAKSVSNSLIKQLNADLEKKMKDRRKGRIWVRTWIGRRNKLGASQKLLTELVTEDPESYKNHLRITEKQFNTLLECVKPYIQRKNMPMRDAIPAELKLQITLRYLASGDSFASLGHLYRVPKCTISKFLPEVCDAIFLALKDYIKVPNTTEEWEKIRQGFSTRWNFPNCYGAIDGKHIILRCPTRSGSNFYNYKGTFSIVLMAVVDDQYCFTYIDVGANGRASDGGIFSRCSFKRAIEEKMLNLPTNAIFVADDAFPLKEYLLKPYSHHGALTLKERIFNYRLSRARRIVENAFGILVSRFRVFEKPIALCPNKVDKIVKVACALHNWLLMTSKNYIVRGNVDEDDLENGGVMKGSWRHEVIGTSLRDVTSTNESRNYSKAAAQIRNKLADWFVGDGAVPWQIKMINGNDGKNEN